MADSRSKMPASAPIGPLKSAAIYGRNTAANIAHKLVKSRTRTRHKVLEDYDQGEWAQLLQLAPWENISTLRDYNRKSWRNENLTAMIDGQLVDISSRDYYDVKFQKLSAIMKTYAGDDDEIVELGSGGGTNLMLMAEADHWKNISGYELSETGQNVTRKLIAHFGLDNVDVGFIDLLDISSEGFDRLQGKTVFTHYCLEQIPDHTDLVFQNLIAAGIKRAIHIEPTWELMKVTSLRDLASISYIWRQDYQRTIVKTAEQFASRNQINLIKAERLNFVSSCRNDPTLVVWEPKR